MAEVSKRLDCGVIVHRPNIPGRPTLNHPLTSRRRTCPRSKNLRMVFLLQLKMRKHPHLIQLPSSPRRRNLIIILRYIQHQLPCSRHSNIRPARLRNRAVMRNRLLLRNKVRPRHYLSGRITVLKNPEPHAVVVIFGFLKLAKVIVDHADFVVGD